MSYNDRVDRRFGPGYPNCALNKGRVSVRLDFGLGHVFTVEYQSGAVAPLLRAVATIRKINDDPNDPRTYHVHSAGHRVHGAYDVTIAGTYACRPINNPHDPDSEDPSPHSWPLALDINPAQNGWGAGLGDHPDWFRQAFLDEGFSWGGEWGDPMHYERLDWTGEWDGTYPEEDDVSFEDFKKGWKEHRANKPKPAQEGDEQFGWTARQEATSQPKPGTVSEHIHRTGPPVEQ